MMDSDKKKKNCAIDFYIINIDYQNENKITYETK